MDVAAVNFHQRIAIMDDDSIIPMTNMYDDDGEECDDPDEAASAVLGPDVNGRWYTIDRRDWVPTENH